MPSSRIDQALAQKGGPVYESACARCHELDGELVGQVTPLADIGTDPERLRSFTAELADRMNTIGTGTPWKFSHFRKTEGYANMPLDGVWLNAPYLHNGSVPTLSDLLEPPASRPARFWRGYDVYDQAKLGFVSDVPEADGQVFSRYDTSVPGNGNTGHVYGTTLPDDDKRAIVEYLKTF